MAMGGAATNTSHLLKVSVGGAFSDGPMAEMRMQGLKKMWFISMLELTL